MSNILSPFAGLAAYLLEKITNPVIKKKLKGEAENICVLLLQGIGNTILFLPALEALHNKFPK